MSASTWFARFVGLVGVLLTTEAFGDELPPHAIAQFGSARFAHGDFVRKLVPFPERAQIMALGMREVRVWDRDGSLARILPPKGNLTNVSHSVDGRWVLGSTQIPDGERGTKWIRVVANVVTGERVFTQPTKYIAYSSTYSHSARLLAVGDPGALVRLIDTTSGEELDQLVLPGPKNFAQYPRLFMDQAGRLLLAEQPPNGTWHVFDLKDRNLANELPGLNNWRNAKPVFSARLGVAAMVGWHGRVVIRDFHEQRDLATFRHGRLTALGGAFSPDERTFVTCGMDSLLRVWDAETGQLRREVDTDEQTVQAVAFMPNGTTIVSSGGHGRIRFWDAGTGEEQLVDPAATGFGGVASVALSPDNRIVALGSRQGEIGLWTTEGERLGILPDRDPPGGRFDSWIGNNFMTFINDELLVAGSSFRHNSVNVWNVATRQRQALGHHSPITCVAVAPSGEMIVSGSRDRTVTAWDRLGNRLWKVQGNGIQVVTVTFSKDGRHVLSAGHTDKIDVWDAATGKPTGTIAMDGSEDARLNVISGIATDGEYLAALLGDSTRGHRVVVRRLADQAVVFDLGADQPPLRPAMTFHSLAFHPSGRLLAVGSSDGEVTLHDVRSGKTRQTYRGHTSAVTSVDWNTSGSRLLSGSSDGSAILWDTAPAVIASPSQLRRASIVGRQ